MARIISVIGAGSIGREIIDFVRSSPGLAIGRILTRSGHHDAADIQEFLATPADIIIDSAGPGALRRFGLLALERSEVWTVGAAALADDGFRLAVLEACRKHSTRLRLFSPWISGIASNTHGAGSSLHVIQRRPGLDRAWSGPIRKGVQLFPDDLNSAVAAALCGPGLERTTVDIADAGEGGLHMIEARLSLPGRTFVTRVEFGSAVEGGHPAAQAVIRALEALDQPVAYG